MRRFLSFFVLLALALLLSATFYFRDMGATHPVLANADLPPLIQAYEFYADPRAAYGYTVSNDGKLISRVEAGIAGPKVVVLDVESGQRLGTFPGNISNVHWHPDNQWIRFMHNRDLWQADPRQPEPENWKRVTPIKLSGGWFLTHFFANHDAPLLVRGREHLRGKAHLYRVSLDGRDSEKVAEGNDEVAFWVLSEQLEPVLRVDYNDDIIKRVMRKSGETWNLLFEMPVTEFYQPLTLVDEDGFFLAYSSRNRDKKALVKVDAGTGQEMVLLQNPDAELQGTTYLSNDLVPDMIRMGPDTFDRKALTPRGEVLLSILEEFPQPVAIGRHIGTTVSGRFATIALSPQQQSFVYLLIDFETGTWRNLGDFHIRKRRGGELAGMKPIRIPARDGLELPATITMPAGIDGPIPFVVSIHGGPAGHSRLRYSEDVQFLANRGYGVLEVNFRGSTGFGKEFRELGYNEFGRAMQDDITDAAKWLVSEGLADPDALVAMGASYGGYSAAMAMAREPGLFDAAVVEFPMLDVEFQTRYHPGFWTGSKQTWWNYFGKLDNQDQVETMRRYSPINRVEDIHGPMLVIAGNRDQITAAQQVRDFQEAALAAGKQLEVHFLPNAGHGASRWQDRLKRARLIEDFLAQTIGGRSAGKDPVEMVSDFYQ